MFRYLSERLHGWDAIPPRRLVWINLFVAGFVLVAHGGAAIVGKTIPLALYVTIPASVLLLSLSIYALLFPERQQHVLRLQSGLLMAGWAGMLFFSVDIAFNGVSFDDKRFSWNPILFALVCAYPIYLARRAFFQARDMPFWLRYAHVIAAVASVVISVLVFRRIGERF